MALKFGHQPHIPSVPGIRGFPTKEKVLKTADFVVEKIKSNIIPPSLNKDELDSLDIIL